MSFPHSGAVSFVAITMLVAAAGVSVAQEGAAPATGEPAISTAPEAGALLLVTPLASKETVLIGVDGKEKHVWPSEHAAAGGARLLPDGSILRIAAIPPSASYWGRVRGGRVQRIAWDGKVMWDFWNAASLHMVCGDALLMPNGNVLMSTLEHRSKDECIQLGLDPAKLTPKGMYAPGLMEFTPRGDKGGRLVWRWSLWEHVSQGRSEQLPSYDPKGEKKGRLNVEMLPGDGLACAELDYDPASNLILLTLPALGEVWMVDRGTTMAEAKVDAGGARGCGGAILWRWRASPGDLASSPSAILSGSFQLKPDSGISTAPPVVRVLARRAQTGGKSELRFEAVQPVLSVESGQVSTAIEVAEVIVAWPEPAGARPPGRGMVLCSGLETGWSFADTWQGKVTWSPQPGSTQQDWMYLNTREASVRTAPPKIEGLRRAVPATAPASVPPVVLRKDIGRPRWYPGSFVPTLQ